ncbi:MAG: hypothetical protein ACLFWB_01040 [Armatimonadota bacterium]
MSDGRKITRREFLRQMGRYALALFLGGGATYLVTKDDEKCINNSMCRGCGRLRTCHLPAAVSTRQAVEQEKADV